MLNLEPILYLICLIFYFFVIAMARSRSKSDMVVFNATFAARQAKWLKDMLEQQESTEEPMMQE